jgi:hypothetical protein
MVAGLLDLLEACMDDDPEERPTNAEDLAARIEMLLSPALPHVLLPGLIGIMLGSSCSPRLGQVDKTMKRDCTSPRWRIGLVAVWSAGSWRAAAVATASLLPHPP